MYHRVLDRSRGAMAWVVGLFGLAALVWSASAGACDCLSESSAQTIDARYVVFVGKAVEYLQRPWCSDAVQSEDESIGQERVDSVTRFTVQYSHSLPVGNEVLVFGERSFDCGSFFAVGEEHLVVANRVDSVLLASHCPVFGTSTADELRAKLGAPRNRRWSAPFIPSGCKQPPTLDISVAKSDAIVWTVPTASCTRDGSAVVEHVVSVTESWKGPANDEVLNLRVIGLGKREYSHFDFEYELSEATGHAWPPADFLRKEGDIYVDDGCLVPMHPPTLEAGVESLTRLLPIPDRRRFRDLKCSPMPRLACARLDQATLVAANKMLASHYAREKGAAAGAVNPAGPPRVISHRHSGSCAGCMVHTSHPFSFQAAPITAILAIVLLLFRKANASD